MGRLLAGIEYAKTDGRAGHNTRLTDTRVVISEAKANGWILAGAGPAADETYFPARFPSGTLRPNALWVSVLFDFGLIGVLLLAVLMVIAVWRMRHRTQMCAILLPFFVASLINSAEGSFEYGFVVLGIMLFALGWAGVPQAVAPPSRVHVDGPREVAGHRLARASSARSPAGYLVRCRRLPAAGCPASAAPFACTGTIDVRGSYDRYADPCLYP